MNHAAVDKLVLDLAFISSQQHRSPASLTSTQPNTSLAANHLTQLHQNHILLFPFPISQPNTKRPSKMTQQGLAYDMLSSFAAFSSDEQRLNNMIQSRTNYSDLAQLLQDNLSKISGLAYWRRFEDVPGWRVGMLASNYPQWEDGRLLLDHATAIGFAISQKQPSLMHKVLFHCERILREGRVAVHYKTPVSRAYHALPLDTEQEWDNTIRKVIVEKQDNDYRDDFLYVLLDRCIFYSSAECLYMLINSVPGFRDRVTNMYKASFQEALEADSADDNHATLRLLADNAAGTGRMVVNAEQSFADPLRHALSATALWILLLSGHYPAFFNETSLTALHYHCDQLSTPPEVISALVRGGGVPIDAVAPGFADLEGLTFLYPGFPRRVRMLTALTIAARRLNIKAVGQLLRLGADPGGYTSPTVRARITPAACEQAVRTDSGEPNAEIAGELPLHALFSQQIAAIGKCPIPLLHELDVFTNNDPPFEDALTPYNGEYNGTPYSGFYRFAEAPKTMRLNQFDTDIFNLSWGSDDMQVVRPRRLEKYRECRCWTRREGNKNDKPLLWLTGINDFGHRAFAVASTLLSAGSTQYVNTEETGLTSPFARFLSLMLEIFRHIRRHISERGYPDGTTVDTLPNRTTGYLGDTLSIAAWGHLKQFEYNTELAIFGDIYDLFVQAGGLVLGQSPGLGGLDRLVEVLAMPDPAWQQ